MFYYPKFTDKTEAHMHTLRLYKEAYVLIS